MFTAKKTRGCQRFQKMSLDSWNGMERFLSGPNGEWLNLVSRTTPSYIEDHQERLEELERQQDAYLLAYGLEAEDLVNPTVKYDSEGLVE